MTNDTAPPRANAREGMMRNSVGHLVPIEMVKPEHLLEDGLVRDLTARAMDLEKAIAQFREHVLAEVASLRSIIADQYGVTKGGAQGNVTLTSFDGKLQVQVSVGQSITFGPELSAAKELIDGCVMRWSKDSGAEIQALVQHAFQVNQQGKIDTGRVLGLRKLPIEDAEWQRAMEAISDAVRVTRSKTYTRFYHRDPIQEHLTPISLNIANAQVPA